MISPELVFADENVATLRVPRADPAQKPYVRYLSKGTVPDHGEERVSSGHREYDYLEWISRLTSHIPDHPWKKRNSYLISCRFNVIF